MQELRRQDRSARSLLLESRTRGRYELPHHSLQRDVHWPKAMSRKAASHAASSSSSNVIRSCGLSKRRNSRKRSSRKYQMPLSQTFGSGRMPSIAEVSVPDLKKLTEGGPLSARKVADATALPI